MVFKSDIAFSRKKCMPTFNGSPQRPIPKPAPVQCCTGRCNQGRDCPLLPKRPTHSLPWSYLTLVAIAVCYLLALVVLK